MQRDGSDLTPLLDVLRENNPAVTTKAPILILQGTADGTVFPFTTDRLNDELVALGDQVTYSKYEGVDHVGITSAAEAEALAFMEKRLPPRKRAVAEIESPADEGGGDLRERRPGRPPLRGRPRPRVPRRLRA